eukprot:1011134-Rhodomonas_salina.1
MQTEQFPAIKCRGRAGEALSGREHGMREWRDLRSSPPPKSKTKANLFWPRSTKANDAPTAGVDFAAETRLRSAVRRQIRCTSGSAWYVYCLGPMS